ncbi:hypothetical protein [Serinicoccus kebangsaanensis]|uniref:hypothetical protein n=1 Tax=Serinicoccus kebangsaanensis TaxID=2602069 RepID=UPI00124DA797|nr:hypothetical protein [Serinicoccus kebangsaanensis]
MRAAWSALALAGGLLLAGCDDAETGPTDGTGVSSPPTDASTTDEPSREEASPEATTSEEAAPTTSSAPAASDEAAPCDAETIAPAVDREEFVVEVCAGDWAYGSTPAPGDTALFVRRSAGSWERYDQQPSTRCRSEAEEDGVPQELLSYFRACGADDSSAGEGDLGVGVSITRPECDGSGIVVLGSAVDPTSYARDVGALLREHPDASYLRTDLACPSLRQQSEQGDPVYAVFRPAGNSRQSICAEVREAGGDAYGKRLDTSSDPDTVVDCS